MQNSNYQSFHGLCEVLADDWATLLIRYNCTALLQPKLQRYTLFLARKLVAAISTEPIDRETVRAVGAAVARLCEAKEETLGRTQELVAHHLLNVPDTETSTFQPYVVALLAELAVGFVQQAHVEHLLLPKFLLAERMSNEGVQQLAQPSLNRLLTNLPIVLFKTDRTGTITFSEGQGLRRLGISSQELVGRSVSKVCHAFFPHDAENILYHLSHALDGETLHTTGMAGHVIFDIQYEPLRDEHGAVTGVTGVALDITEQARAQSELAEIRSLLAENQDLQLPRLAIQRFTQNLHASSPNVPLNEREHHIMRLVIAGQTGQLISQKLGISQRTVASTIQAVIEKLGVNSRAEAIRRIVELGLIKE